MAEGGTNNKQRVERTSNERPAQLMDKMAVKEVFTQLGEAENIGIDVSAQRLKDSQQSPSLQWAKVGLVDQLEG